MGTAPRPGERFGEASRCRAVAAAPRRGGLLPAARSTAARGGPGRSSGHGRPPRRQGLQSPSGLPPSAPIPLPVPRPWVSTEHLAVGDGDSGAPIHTRTSRLRSACYRTWRGAWTPKASTDADSVGASPTLAGHDERHRESAQSHAPCETKCETLARRDDGAALGGRRRARSRKGVPSGERVSRYAGARRCPSGARRAAGTHRQDGCVVVNRAALSFNSARNIP